MIQNLNALKEFIKTLPVELLAITDSIYLYGSMARGDISDDSDCDILVAIEDCDDLLFEQINAKIADWHPELRYELALYPINALATMQEKGSLFLWHIKTEGIELYSKGKKLKCILDNLPAYDHCRDALSEYADIMKDINENATDDKCIMEYDLSVMATLIRNICIICCYLIGNMQFGRVSPVKTCAEHWKDRFPIVIKEYEELYRYRTAITRGVDLPVQSNLEHYCNIWKDRTNKLLHLADLLME